MAAPTNPANVKKVLANPEPSTHGTEQTIDAVAARFVAGVQLTLPANCPTSVVDPKLTFAEADREVAEGRKAGL